MVLLIGGLPQERATRHSTHPGCTVFGKNLHKHPPETCVYDELPFVHSDVSASEITLLVLKEEAVESRPSQKTPADESYR